MDYVVYGEVVRWRFYGSSRSCVCEAELENMPEAANNFNDNEKFRLVNVSQTP